MFFIISVTFRIKQFMSGLCWELIGTVVKLTSKCRDLFYFTENLKIYHVASGKQIFLKSGTGFTTVSTSSPQIAYIKDAITVISGWRFGYCFTENEQDTHTSGGNKYLSQLPCTANETKLIFRPGNSFIFKYGIFKGCIFDVCNYRPAV